MTTVEIYRVKYYNYSQIKAIIHKIFNSRPDLIHKGEKILVKPNLLAPTKPQRAVVTHPSIVKAVCEEIIERGAHPVIGDSPALSKAKKVGSVSGIGEIAKQLGIPLIELDNPVEVKTRWFFKRIEVSKRIFDFDKIINLPKFKTHTQMVLTLAIKNMFGVVPGKRKGEWHLRASNYMDFARMLLSVYGFRQPDLNIVDGILAMEGEGPQNGDPFLLGLILASDDGLVLDWVSAKIVRAENYSYVLRVAMEEGIINKDIKIKGDFHTLAEEKNFKLPSTTPISPEFARRILRGALPKPVIIADKCTACGFCKEACPTGSIIEVGKKPKINYSSCISCFVCQEVCPFNSIEIKRGIIARLI